MTDSIAGHVARCLTLFRALLEPPDGDELDFPDPGVVLQMMDERSRFKVWAGNIGAHRTGMSSLDYRLRDASHIKSQVLDLVRGLIQLIEDASAIAKGEETPWDQRDSGEDGYVGSDSDDEAPDTELGQIAADMADVINCLLRLTVTIRNPAPHDRYIQAKDTDASYFEPYDVQHVRSKFSEIEPWLEERLGKAISRRRQYLRYRQSHHQKLSRGLDQELDEGNGLEDETIASSIPSHLKEGRNTDTSVLRDDGSDAGMSQTLYATSMACSDRLTIPPLPKEAYAGPFECPLCHMIIEVRDRRAWKKHVYGDLQPYVCLENDCMTPEREYFRRHEWIEHVKQNHWKTYRCLLCQSKLSSFADCKSHLEASHPSKRSPGELDALVKLCEQALDISKGMPCPLCREDLHSIPQYQRHVGRHQEQLSLFALPSLDTEGEVDGDEEDSGDHQDTDSILEDQADAHSRSQIVSPESGEHPTGSHEDASSVPDGYIVEVKRIYREREGTEEEELTGRRKTHLDGQLEVPEKVTIDAASRELKEAQERQIDWMKQATELLAGIKAAEHIWKEKDAMGEDGSAPSHPASSWTETGESARDHFLYKHAFPQADGLFHCPWEGEASCNHKPEKLKCNYDKLVDSHLKPYRCKVEGCQNYRFRSTASLLRHELEAHAMHGHGEKPYLCTYEGFERSTPGNGFPRQWNLRDHMRRVHNDNGTAAQPPCDSVPPSKHDG